MLKKWKKKFILSKIFLLSDILWVENILLLLCIGLYLFVLVWVSYIFLLMLVKKVKYYVYKVNNKIFQEIGKRSKREAMFVCISFEVIKIKKYFLIFFVLFKNNFDWILKSKFFFIFFNNINIYILWENQK